MPLPQTDIRGALGRPLPDLGDTFRRVIASASGLGLSDWSGPFTLGGTNTWGVDGEYGTVTASAGATRRCGFLTPPRLVLDQDMYVEVQFSTAPLTTYFAFWLCGRLTAIDGDMYRVYLLCNPDLTVMSRAEKMVANATTGLGAGETNTGLTFAANTNYAMRVQIYGQGTATIRVKVWLAGTPEPATWLYTVTDTSLTAPGGIGYRFFHNTGGTAGTVTCKFRNFRQLSRRIAA